MAINSLAINKCLSPVPWLLSVRESNTVPTLTIVLVSTQRDSLMAKAEAKSKMQVVREIVAKGTTKTSDIVAAAKEMGVTITPATAANYKHQLGASKPRKRGRPRGSKKSKVTHVVRTPSSVTTDLELENLALRLIVKAGGPAKARQLIDRIG